jgi:hypothetical protein
LEKNIMTNMTDLSVDSLSLGGTALTPSALEINNVADKETLQTLVADGAITIKSGVCKIAKTVAGVVAATLANPTDGTDDFKKLLVISNQAQANTLTVTGGFGNGGTGKDVCTFGGAVGDCIELMAYGAKWYVTGGTGFTLA